MEQLAYDERAQQLRRLDVLIHAWMNMLRNRADALDAEQMQSLIQTAERYALRLNDNLPPDLDSAAVAEIRGIIIGALAKVKEADDRQPLDLLDDFLLRAESIRHILRDALDDELPISENDPAGVLRQLVEWLPGVPKKEIPELLGIDLRTMQRWTKQSGGRASHRLYLVASLVNQLKGAWTPEGVIAWFHRPRRELEGRAPLDVLDNAAYERILLTTAREGRAQHGS